MAVLFHPLIPVDKTHFLPLLREALREHDFRVFPDTGDKADITALITWKLFKGDATAYPNLRTILSLSAGVNQYIGHPELPKNVRLVRMIEPGLSQGMMEYVISYVMRFHKQHDHMKALAAQPWGSTIPPLASQRRIGIMGMGEMGRACATALTALGFPVNGWSRSDKTITGITHFTGQAGLGDFLKNTDILVCLLPLTADTQGILNKETLSLLPRGACLINAARGKHLVEEDLIPLLHSGHLDQAALDVFRVEPLPADHPFQHEMRIHITPHLAAITRPESAVESIKQALEQLAKGEDPAGLVDLGRGY